MLLGCSICGLFFSTLQEPAPACPAVNIVKPCVLCSLSSSQGTLEGRVSSPFSDEASEAREIKMLPSMTQRRDSVQTCVTAGPGPVCRALLPSRTHVSLGLSARLGRPTAPHSALRLPPPRQQRPDRVHGDHQGRRHGPAVPGCRYLPDEFGGARRVQTRLGCGQVRGPSAGMELPKLFSVVCTNVQKVSSL